MSKNKILGTLLLSITTLSLLAPTVNAQNIDSDWGTLANPIPIRTASEIAEILKQKEKTIKDTTTQSTTTANTVTEFETKTEPTTTIQNTNSFELSLNPKTFEEIQRPNDDPHETVVFNGSKEIQIQLTDEQKQEYQQTGKFTYTPNWENVSRHLITIIKQLRQINNIDIPVSEFSNEALQYAKFRAEEQLTNNIDTDSKPKLDHDNSKDTTNRQFENLLATPVSFSSYTNWKSDNRILSDEHLAYYIALSWFSDYNNVSGDGSGYGHRIALLFYPSDSQAVYGVNLNQDEYNQTPDKKYLYIAQTGYDIASNEDFNNLYDHGELLESQISYDSNNIMYFNNKRLSFIEDITFKYVLSEQ